ncbi:Bardet-Biedl syndrome 1 protein isoform X2 [Acyrthosiphon pisum]|uniref:Bardet-Biedl syndrome 1 n=1 Tax=Acyrthosiphon pisum TaxID=7029 RepID=A0A8R2NMF9_ACYPI|nr:Bardet-Biedl syndrome 1 protein isoform X2 [Acyrthosiphon pisum]
MNSTWIDVDINPPINLQTYNCCMMLSDVHGDNDNKFVVVDFGSGTSSPQLKIFKGLKQTHVIYLNEKPSAITTVYTDNSEQHIPCVAVVIKNEIYFYRNCKPYHKYSIQSTTIRDTEECKLWQESEDAFDLLKRLQVLSSTIGFVSLSTTSQQMLCLNECHVNEYFEKCRKTNLVKQHTITCVTELKRNMSDVHGVSCLVIATTDMISILDTESFKILPDKYELQGETAYMSATGLYDVDYKILVATRTGRLYIFSKSSTSGFKVETTHAIVAVILRIDKFICCTIDGLLQCYTLKCVSLWNVKLPGDPTSMVNMYVQSMSLEMTVVSCNVINADGHSRGLVLMYCGSTVIHKISMPDTVTCITFGRFGQEENALIMINTNGKVDIKLLKRTATFDLCVRPTLTAHVQGNLSIPKRSNVFIEQTLREREHCKEMHVRTQQTWQLLQIVVSNERLNSIKQKVTSQFLHTSAQLLGLGPRFKIRFFLKNLGKDPLMGINVAFLYNAEYHSIESPRCRVPIIVPGTEIYCETFVTCCTYGGSDDRAIDIIVNRGTNVMYRAKVNMPVYNIQTSNLSEELNDIMS